MKIKKIWLTTAFLLSCFTSVAQAELIIADSSDLKIDANGQKIHAYTAKRGEMMSSVMQKWASVSGLTLIYETSFDSALTADVKAFDISSAVVALAVQFIAVDKGTTVNMNQDGKIIVQDFSKDKK